MDSEGVLISYRTKGSSKSTESSGILFNGSYVLTTATIFIPLLHIPEERKWVTSLVKSSSSKVEKNNNISRVLFRVFKEVKDEETNKVKDGRLISLESQIIGVWKSSLVTHSLEKLFYDWTLGHVNDSKLMSLNDIDTSKDLMSIFIILKCTDEPKQEQTMKKMKNSDDVQELFDIALGLGEPVRGQEVEVVSTPFGNRLFLNSLSRGIISNVVGLENCLILTDARTVSGCEGGPIFAAIKSRIQDNKKKLIGLVTCPLTWWRGEWVGLTIGISLAPVLKKLLQIETSCKKLICGTEQICTDISSLEAVDNTIVLVQNNTSWGSGVILDGPKGIIITCSHVIKNNKNILIIYKNRKYPVSIIFRSQDDIAYDLAVLKISGISPFENAIKYCNDHAAVGEAVIAAGFPFFFEKNEFNLQPCLVSGCVARINPFMIQTTCCIQSGFSGGPLLKQGQLLGIIVSNAKDVEAGALFPHVNFIIPSIVFKDILTNYIKSDNTEVLKSLESSDPAIQSLWALQTSKL